MSAPPLGIIAGTGFYDLGALQDAVDETVSTAFGDARVTRGTWHGVPVVFLTRHGAGHSVPPHLVNYRANIRALADLGVRDVVAVNVTGSIDPDLRPGDLLCLDDFLDLTRRRPVTFFDGSGPEGVVHIDVVEPYHPELRREILESASGAGQPMRDGGVYVCFEGPRFETRAEIRLARLAGGDVAGMTGVPEVTLAAEAGLRYAAISLVVNPASGVGDSTEPITMDDINQVLTSSAAKVLAVLDELVHTRATFPNPDPDPDPDDHRMSRLRIENAAHVVTVDATDRILTGATVEVDDGVITAITPATDGPGPGPDAGVTTIDARGKLLMPGLVNLHTHLPMTLLRGLAENLDLDGFLQHLWAAEAAVMDEESVELGATLGALESLLGGCTTQLDMYFHHEATHRGAVAAGSRHVIGPVFFDGPGPDGLAWPERLANLRAWPALLDEIGGPQVPVSAMPHATYTCSPEGLTEVVATLRKVLADTGRPGMLTTHVSETAAENAGIRERYDATPTELLARTGWVEPDLPLVIGHGVHLSASDRDLLAAAGAGIGHCPGSNLKLASGALHWEEVRDSGIRLGIGTDGCSSSNDLDMWQAMRQAALLARLTSGRPDVASAAEVLRAATIEGARALGLGDVVGSVEVGKRADLVLVDLAAPHLTPVHDVPALLVFAAGRADVTDVLVDGRPVVRDRRSTLLDTPTLLARARARGEVARAASEAL